MDYHTYRFDDPDCIIERLHALFERWDQEEQPFEQPLDGTTLHTLKLAMHEWLANLVQHASFAGESPDIIIALKSNGSSIQCIIEDNSAGFDLDGQLSARPEVLDAFPERGMGLLMIKACTDHLS